MIIPSGNGRNGDLSMTIILLKKNTPSLHLFFRSVSTNINQISKQALFPKSKDDPTGCATSCPSQMKWLQIALCCIHGFGMALLPGRQKTSREERQVLR